MRRIPIPPVAIDRYDMETGEIKRVVSGHGGSVRPAPSPDGRRIAFVRRERAKSKLYVKDFASGKERKLFDLLGSGYAGDLGCAGHVTPIWTGTPGQSGDCLLDRCKIWRIAASGGTPVEIPFRVQDRRQVIDRRDRMWLSHRIISVRGCRALPAFHRMVRTFSFETLGKIYLKAALAPSDPPRNGSQG